MTNPPDSDADLRADAAAAAAWLAGDGEASPLTRLSGADCLAVARAMLSATIPPGSENASARTLQGHLQSVAERVPAMAVWLSSVLQGGSSPSAPAGPADDGDAVLLTRFAAALVLPGEDRSPSGCRGTRPDGEAAVLRETVRLALEHVCLRAQFDRAVADARLEAMRELAYGAGHEINNPLANIATRAQALLLDETDPERRRRLSTIVDQSFRARDMIGGLMLFARPPKPRREAVDVGGIIAAAIESVRGQAVARGGRLEYSPPPMPESVFVDRVQVEEAIRVVVVNALEALVSGGRVVLEVASSPRGPAGMCEVTVTDDGHGMSFETARRAFDPFYSGREAGRGAGLGLPKAWRLVEASGGTVLLDSRQGHGTRVSILLPRASSPSACAVDAQA